MAKLALVFAAALAAISLGQAPAPDWAMNATVIEACSCPVFCPCQFSMNHSPASHDMHGGHGTERFCRLNRAVNVNQGSFGKTQLEGTRFWMAGDLGPNFTSSNDQYDWEVVRFDPSVTKEQRAAMAVIVPVLFPGKWKSFVVESDSVLEWKHTKDRVEARLDGGKTAEIVLSKAQGMTSDPVVVKNLPYEGATSNDGFIVMPSEVEAYRVGSKPFEFKGTNGFVITVSINSKAK
jgi:hypothetical protein